MSCYTDRFDEDSDNNYDEDTRETKLDLLRKINPLFYEAKSVGGIIEKEPCRLHELLPEVPSAAQLDASDEIDWDAVRRRIAKDPDDVRRPYVRVRRRSGPLTNQLETTSWVLHQLLYRGEQVPADVIVSAVEAFPEALRLPMRGADRGKDDFFLPAGVDSFPLEYACRSGGALPPETIRLLAQRTAGECMNSKNYSFFELFGFVLHMGYDNDAVRVVMYANDMINALLAQKKYVLTTVGHPEGFIKCKAGEDKGDPLSNNEQRRVRTYLEFFAWNTFVNGFRNKNVSFWQISVEDRRLCWERAKILFSKRGPSVLHAILAQMPQECFMINTDAWGNLLQCAQMFDPELFQQTNELGDLPLHCFLKTKTWSGGPKSKRGRVLVHIISKAYPKALKRHDCDGRLPLHLAVKNYPNYGAIDELFMVEPGALSTPDLCERMRPFQIAWAQYWYESMKRSNSNTCNDENDDELEMFNLTMTYKLIRSGPLSVCHTNASPFVAKIVELEKLLHQLKRKADLEGPAGAVKRKHGEI